MEFFDSTIGLALMASSLIFFVLSNRAENLAVQGEDE